MKKLFNKTVNTLRKIHTMKIWILSIFILFTFIANPVLLVQPKESFGFTNTIDTEQSVPSADLASVLDSDHENGIPTLSNSNSSLRSDNATYPEDFDVGSFLSDRKNIYSKEWDPWLTKAAIHAIASSKDIPFMEDGDMIALAGGYLYDQEVHIYRWNYQTDQYDHVWDVGDGIFQSDILSVTFADTDYNNLTELICGGEDGRIYVFEQRHIYDPETNMENQFDLVWKSNRLGRIFDVTVDDTDLDNRQDIIVGTGNTVRFYEYDEHGGYPFSEDHWIDFKQVFSYEFSSPITALSTTDVNYNGLPEVVIGLKSGNVQLLENDGTHLMVNGYPYPITQDNAYTRIWDSGTTIWKAISDVSGGNLDEDNTREVIVAVQGQGAYILDTYGGDIGLYRLERGFNPDWETQGAYPLDYWLDSIVNSSSTIGLDNVYYQNTSGTWTEPLNYSSFGFPHLYPYKSAAVQESDNEFTFFDGNSQYAWAIFDFGNDEEAAGNGVPSLGDLVVTDGTESGNPTVIYSISQDGTDYYPLTQVDTNEYDVDSVLASQQWEYYRYLKVNVSGGIHKIDKIETKSINKPLYDALSTSIGKMLLAGDSTPTKVGFIGTLDGAILAITKESGKYQVIWDSYREERWKMQKNIFSLTTVKKTGNFPAWIFRNSSSESDFLGVPDAGDLISYDTENFQWIFDKNTEVIKASSTGKLFAFKQQSEDSLLQYDSSATNSLFETSYSGSEVLQDYLDTQVDADYYGVNIVPMYLPQNHSSMGFFLMISSWDGSLGTMDVDNLPDPDRGEIDIHLSYLYLTYSGGEYKYFFTPVRNGYWGDSGATAQTISNTESSGQMYGIFRESTWMPKVSSADFLGDHTRDLVVTNGESVQLLETTTLDLPDLNTQAYPVLETNLVGGYFKEINENSKGRQWSNPEPVDFDNDGDLDLILGFGRYDADEFDIEKMNYGMTYFENEGTAQEPIWVEKKKAVTNNQIGSNFRVHHYSDPTLIYDNYEYEENADPGIYRYHPTYRDSKPTRLMMFQAYSNYSFTGYITQFYAQYSHPTSLLAATYPEAKRIDMNLLTTSQETNFGFHIFETWNNEDNLREWTLSMDTADLDEDGKNEVVVGDFDNNVYVFEHLTNNSYKRAFRSHDINRTVRTTDSPYAFEQFEGISGSFNRTIFDHIEYVVAGGIDLNENNLQEFLAATADQIFVFEAISTVTGRIRDDTYRLVLTVDIRDFNSTILNSLPTEKTKISALATADDMTEDGRGELVVGIESALLVLEVNEDFTLDEIFYEDSYNHQGKYDVPGNYFKHPEYTINNILIDDVDKDGFINLIISGINKTMARPLWSGFITILEWKGHEFVYSMSNTERKGSATVILSDIWYGTYPVIFSGSQYHITDFTPMTKHGNLIYDIEIDDADLDGNKELVIGHSNGVDIYENVGDDNFKLQERMTSNPNYPQLSTAYWKVDTDYKDAKDVIRLDNGTLLLAYVSGFRVYVAKSNNDGYTWESTTLAIDPGSNRPSSISPLWWVRHPGLGLANDGTIYLSYEETYEYSFIIGETTYTGNNTALQVLIHDGSQWRTDVLTTIDNFDVEHGYNALGNSHYSPSLYPYNSTAIGITYNYPRQYSGYDRQIRFKHLSFDGSNIIDSYAGVGVFPWANGTKAPENFHVSSLDTTQISSDTYGLVWSGYLYSEELALDYDLFYSQFTKNTTSGGYNFIHPTRITTTGLNSYNPSIITEQYTNNLLVAYEEASNRMYGGLWAVWSNDDGINWNGPHDMLPATGLDTRLMPYNIFNAGRGNDNTIRLDSYKPENTQSGETFQLIWNDFGGKGGYNKIPIDVFQVNYPTLIPGRTSDGADGHGFAMTYSIRFGPQIFTQGSLESYFATAVNPFSNFTWYNIDKVTDLTVGDSDKDGRHEILVNNGKVARSFEFSNNGASYIHHTQKWTSPEYERDITDIAISDSNGNGLPEIIIESDRGIVHSYEIVNKRGTKADVLYPVKEQSLDFSTPHTYSNRVYNLFTKDIDSDGIEDILYSTTMGNVTVINGQTLNKIYSFNLQPDNTNYPYSQLEIVMDSNGIPAMLATSHVNNMSLFDIDSGSLMNSLELPSNSITALKTANLDEAGHSEILVGLDNGSILVYDTTFNLKWKTSNAPYYRVNQIEIGHIASQSSLSVVALDLNGSVNVYNAKNGTLMWNQTTSYYGYLDFSTLTYVREDYFGIATVDINNDNHSDIIAGINPTFAFDGITGDQLWNKSGIFPFSHQPQTLDIDNDGVKDIITGRSGFTGYFSTHPSAGGVIAISGSTGEQLWGYKLDSSAFHEGGLLTSLQIGTNRTYYAGVSSDGYGYLMDPYTGTVNAGFPLNTVGYSITTSKLGFDRHVVLIGDAAGHVEIYSLYKGQPTTPSGMVTEITDALYEINTVEHTTNATTEAVDLTGDGYDDYIVISETHIEGYFGQNGTQIGSYNVGSVGSYMEQSEIVDIDQDGDLDLIALYNYEIIAFDLIDNPGTVLWTYDLVTMGTAWTSGSWTIADLDSTSPSLEIIYAHNDLSDPFVPYVRIGVVQGDDGNPYWVTETVYDGYIDPAISVGNYRNLASQQDIVIYLNNPENLGQGQTLLFASDGSLLDEAPIYSDIYTGSYTYEQVVSYAPVYHIASGDFTSHSGEEFVLIYDYSGLSENYPSYMYEYGSQYVVNAVDSGTGSIILGYDYDINFNPHLTKKIIVKDLDGDGWDDIVGVSERGDVFRFDTHNIDLQTEQYDVSMDYSAEKVLLGTYNGSNVAIVADYNVITAYNIDVTTPTVVWTAKIEDAYIDSMAIGNMDSDLDSDIVFIDNKQRSWIIASSYVDDGSKDYANPGPETEELPTVNTNSLEKYSVSPYTLVTSILLVGIVLATFITKPVIRKRRKEVK